MKRLLPALLIALGTLIILGVFVQLYRNGPIAPSFTDDLPQQIAGLHMTDSKTGEAAIDEVSQMHGKDFPMTYGAIVIYGNREITLWVSGTPSDAIAEQMTDAMRAKIAEGNSPFTPSGEIKDGDRSVYVLEGMGQIHYYFQSGNRVIWLAVNPAIADEALQQILEVYS